MIPTNSKIFEGQKLFEHCVKRTNCCTLLFIMHQIDTLMQFIIATLTFDLVREHRKKILDFRESMKVVHRIMLGLLIFVKLAHFHL